MKTQFTQRLCPAFLLFGLIFLCSCENQLDQPPCGLMDLSIDGINYDVNACEDMNFRNGCEYTIDYLELCFEEGGQQYCQELSIAFMALLTEGEYNIVPPQALEGITGEGIYISGYVGELAEDDTLLPYRYMESGRLIVTEADVSESRMSGSFEFTVKRSDAGEELMEFSGTFSNLIW